MADVPLKFGDWTPDLASYNNPGCEIAQNCLPALASPNYAQSDAAVLTTVGPPQGGTYTVNAVQYNGSSNYLSGTSNLTSIGSTKTGTISFWMRVDAAQTSSILNFQGQTGSFTPYFRVNYNSTTGNFKIKGWNSAGTQILELDTTAGTYVVSSTWLNVLASWNLGTGATNLYINNVSDASAVTATNDTIAYANSGNGCFVGAGVQGGATFTIGSNLFATYPTATFTVSGVSPSGYNGSYTANANSSTTVGANIGSNPGSFVSGGTLTTSNFDTYSVDSAKYASGVITFKMDAGSISVGQQFIVTGVTPSAYNGTYTCTSFGLNANGKYVATANYFVPNTLYFSSTASSTLSTANELVTTAPSSASVKVTTVSGTNTLTEVVSQTATYASTNSVLPAADDLGFLWDDTTLEGQTLQAGTYTPSIRLASEQALVVYTLYVRISKRSSAGSYTTIVTPQITWVGTTSFSTINSGWTNNTTVSGTSFSTGDKLYMDVFLYATSNVALNSPFYIQENAGVTGSLVIPSDPGAYVSGGTLAPVYTYTVTNAVYGLSPSSEIDAALAEIWFDTTFFDLSMSGNRAKFIDSNGYPVSLGANGSTPTGSQPILYLKNPAATVGTNSGSGGNLTANGTFTGASTSPSGIFSIQAYVGANVALDTTAVPHLYVGATSYLAELTSTAATNVSKSGGYTTPAGGYWRFAQFLGNVYATNNYDAIQYMAAGSSPFADLSAAAPVAHQINNIGQFIIVGNTKGGTIGGESQGRVPNRVMWSQIDDPTSWPDPLTNAGIAAQAGYEDLNSGYGKVMGITTGLYYGLVFQENGIYNAQYVGGDTVFQFNDYEKQRGCMCPNSIVQIGSLVYFIHSSGFFVTDGQTTQSIGHDKVDLTFLADLNFTYANQVYGAHGPTNKCIYWSYVSNSATTVGGFVVADKVIVYNYEDKRWSMGYIGQTIDLIVNSFDFTTTNKEIVGVIAYQEIGSTGTYAPYYGTFTGAALTATLQTTEVQPSPGGRSYISAIKPVVIGATLSDISVAPVTRATLSDTAVVGTYISPDSRTGKCMVRADDVFLRANVQITNGFTNAEGVEAEVIPSGAA